MAGEPSPTQPTSPLPDAAAPAAGFPPGAAAVPEGSSTAALPTGWQPGAAPEPTAWQSPPTELWSSQPVHQQPAHQPAARRRFPRWVMAVGAVTTVLALTAFLVVLFWPADPTRPLDFTPVEQVGTVALGEDDRAVLAQLSGDDQAYLVVEREAGTAVVATDRAGEIAWDQPVTGSSEVTSISVLDQVVVLIADMAAPASPSRWVVALDRSNGLEAWRHPYPADDQMRLFTGVVVFTDYEARTLLGLSPTTGTSEWEWPFPGEPGDPIPAVLPVLVDEDLAGSSRPGETHDTPRHGNRVLLVGGDRAAAVFDVDRGEVVSQGPGVAGSRDAGFAIGDDLFVASVDDNRVYRFDLTNLQAAPDILYTEAESSWSPQEVVSCGGDRVCVRVDGADEPEIIAIDVSGRRQAWRHPVPGAEYLLPVGDHLVVGTRDPAVVGYDRAGNEVLPLRPGVSVRLNAGNMLLFSGTGGIGTADLSVAGIAFGSGAPDRTELGQVRDVRGAGCAWDERHLACPTAEGAAIWRFTR